MSLTSTQQQAIAARGNVLVVAGAGTGKTRTLVERCLHCLLEERPSASLDEILMVTFTDAAAAEMRQRIRLRLEQQLKDHPEDVHWQEQLALFETAHIGTLHSFCLQLVRQNFYELELDPQLAVLPEEEARLLADETLDALLQKHYAAKTRAAEAVQQLIQAQGRGSDQPIRRLVLRLHHYTQTQPDPAGWLDEQLARFASPKPTDWESWLLRAIVEWRNRWLPLLERFPQNELSAKCVATLRSFQVEPAPSRAEAAPVLQAIAATSQDCPRGKKGAWLNPLENFLGEAAFLNSLTQVAGNGPAPLAEDWEWVRSQMSTLLRLAQEFNGAFTEAKRELGMLDFHDLEQYALRLLWDPKTRQPTKTAEQWRKKFRFVFVDEYQDINAAQDKIIEAISREGTQANRFLVGDIKQSIYRFRLADPHIFQGYVTSWRQGPGRTIPLVDNFRSREGILSFINSLFGLLMRREIGGVDYDEETRLRFGAPEERRPLSAAPGSAPCVELHLRAKGAANAQEQDAETAEALARMMELEEADKEARLVALRLLELKTQQQPVWDEAAKAFRPVEWRDMAILLRAPANKSESYAKEFSRLNVPLLVERGGFYESLEITDLLSLLQMLDNPLQDLPVLAVLHSPLVGLTLNELATIRLTVVKTHFWTALLRWEEARRANLESPTPPPAAAHASRITHHAPLTQHPETYRKVSTFLERFARWRRLARQVSLSRCLEAVLSETHYADWLLTQIRGEQRHANVQRLLGLAQQFDQFQRQGLFRFLRFIEAQQLAETEPDVAAVSEENSVRLMSIHQAKGLEFPVVVVADLGKPFNLADLRADVILDEEYGLCPQVKPPHTGKRYPSLPYWLACRRQTRELLGEELRLLYVAMTRARDLLLLTGSLSEARLNQLWQSPGEISSPALLSARSYADWLSLWFGQHAQPREEDAAAGENEFLRWALHDPAALLGPGAQIPAPSADSAMTAEPAVLRQLEQRLSWTYPLDAATRQPAKTSVSVLRRRAAEALDDAITLLSDMQAPGAGNWSGSSPVTRHPSPSDGPSPASPVPRQLSLFDGPPSSSPVRPPFPVTSADIGNAHHAFLQFVALERVGSIATLKQEAERLRQEEVLTAQQVAALNFNHLAAFWKSDVGRRIRAQAQFVRRELAFTVRFSPLELSVLTGQPPEPNLEEEFVVVQGVADVAVLLSREIWLLDFKTDRVNPDELDGKVKLYTPQLKLYARALTQIYRRPVSECWLYFLTSQNAVPVPPA